MKVDVNIFDYASVSRATRTLDEYFADLREKADELCERLAEIAQDEAQTIYYGAIYDGVNDVEVYVDQIPNGYQVQATGDAVLFIEYGSGATHGYGHPEPEGYGPGTFRGKGHWNDPKGWYLPANALGESGIHTYGNPPAAAMYRAKQEVKNMAQEIADEVFNS